MKVEISMSDSHKKISHHQLSIPHDQVIFLLKPVDIAKVGPGRPRDFIKCSRLARSKSLRHSHCTFYGRIKPVYGVSVMRSLLFAGFAALFCFGAIHAQETPKEGAATKPVQ